MTATSVRDVSRSERGLDNDGGRRDSSTWAWSLGDIVDGDEGPWPLSACRNASSSMGQGIYCSREGKYRSRSYVACDGRDILDSEEGQTKKGWTLATS